MAVIFEQSSDNAPLCPEDMPLILHPLESLQTLNMYGPNLKSIGLMVLEPKTPKKGQKQIDEENVSTLAFYRNIAGASLLIYVTVTVALFSLQWKAYLAIALPAIVYYGCYKFMEHMVNGGMDLTMEGGMAEHAKDLLLVTAILQMLSLISNYFWLLWLIVPGRALYMLWVNILGPWFFAPPPPELDEKQQKKKERKMKQKIVYR